MRRSNLPTGCTDADIERATGQYDEIIAEADHGHCFDRIEALEAEIKRLREELAQVKP